MANIRLGGTDVLTKFRADPTQFNYALISYISISNVSAHNRPTSFKETQFVCPSHSCKFNIVGSLRDREVAYSTSNRQGSNCESCVWRVVSSHHPQEVLLSQFSLYVHKGGLKPHSFHSISTCGFPAECLGLCGCTHSTVTRHVSIAPPPGQG